MKQVIQEDGGRPIKIWTHDIEDEALTQLKNLARLPFIAGNGVACMPDVHAGKGSTIGTVIATDRAVIPAAVGVDIGCGMNAVRLNLVASQLPESLLEVRHQIERDVPLGAGGAVANRIVPEGERGLWMRFAELELPKHLQDLWRRGQNQLGSLGSGNHFIELCLDEEQRVWIMLHSGSRGIGNKIGTHFIEVAKKRMEEYFIKLPDGDLAYLPEDTEDFRSYVAAVSWAQDYALANRAEMMQLTLAALRHSMKDLDIQVTDEAINCHHNYISRENHYGRNLWVTRKGAIRAREGDLGIIPGSMGTKSYIVRGKGEPQSYCSCSHGAGRAMSRAGARRLFNLEDLQRQTAGVECRKDDAVLDELPGAYKDIDVVMANQVDLVDVVHTLKQVLCVKGN